MHNIKSSALTITNSLVSNSCKTNTISKVFIKVNYLNIPIEIWFKITEFLNIQELLSLRKVNKFFAHNIVNIELFLEKSHKRKHSFYRPIYSISSYKDFIAPILESLSPDIKIIIDKYLEKNNNPLLAKQIPNFIFNRVFVATRDLEKTNTTIKSFSIPSTYNNFVISTISGHCAFVKNSTKVVIFSITIKDILKKLISFYPCSHHSNVDYMQFTSKNNLLTCTARGELTLWELNLDNDKEMHTPKKLWNLMLDNNNRINKLILFKTEKDFLVSYFYHEGLYLYSQDSSSYFKKRLITECLNSTTSTLYIKDMIISENNKSLAILSDCISPQHDINYLIYIFSLTNINRIYDEKKFITQKTIIPSTNGISMQFNTKGNIFVYSDLYNKISVFNKVNNEWLCVSSIIEYWPSNLILTPNEKHLIFIKKCKFFQNSPFEPILEIIAIKDIGHKFNFHKNNITYTSMTSLGDKDIENYSHYMHPTGLAVISFNKNTKQFKIILPKKKKFLCNIHKKLYHYYKNNLNLLGKHITVFGIIILLIFVNLFFIFIGESTRKIFLYLNNKYS